MIRFRGQGTYETALIRKLVMINLLISDKIFGRNMDNNMVGRPFVFNNPSLIFIRLVLAHKVIHDGFFYQIFEGEWSLLNAL